MAADDYRDTQGVNDRLQLAVAEAELRRRTNEKLLRQGVSMVDPDRTYIDTTVRVAGDVTIFPGSLLQGRTVIGAGAEIGPDTRLVDCVVGEQAVVEKTVGRDAEVGASAVVGPFAVLEPGESRATRHGHRRVLHFPGERGSGCLSRGGRRLPTEPKGETQVSAAKGPGVARGTAAGAAG